MSACAHLHVCTCVHICMCVHMHMCMNACVCTFVCVCVCTCACVCVCARVRACTQAGRQHSASPAPPTAASALRGAATSRCGHVSLWLRHQHVLPALPCCCRPWAEPRRSLPGARPHLACTGPWSHRAAPATPAGGRGASGRRGHAPSRPGTRVSPHRRSPRTPLTSRSLDRERPPALPPCPSTQRPLSSCTKRILPGIHELSPRCTSVGRGDAIAPPESSHMRAPRLF